jgi:hypothetical protein
MPGTMISNGEKLLRKIRHGVFHALSHLIGSLNEILFITHFIDGYL